MVELKIEAVLLCLSCDVDVVFERRGSGSGGGGVIYKGEVEEGWGGAV